MEICSHDPGMVWDRLALRPEGFRSQRGDCDQNLL